MTKREMFKAMHKFIDHSRPNMDATPEGISPTEFIEDMLKFIDHELDLLDRKRSGSKVSAKDIEKREVLDKIMDTLGYNGSPMRATEIAEAVGESTQRCVGLMRAYISEGLIIREVDKGVAYFRVCE